MTEVQCRFGGPITTACWETSACGCQIIPDTDEAILHDYGKWAKERMDQGFEWGDDVDSDAGASLLMNRMVEYIRR